MTTFKLVANPTFTADVLIPRAGDDPVSVKFTFKHRTKTELNEFIKSRADKEDADSFMEMVSGWDTNIVDEKGSPLPFTSENAKQLLEQRIGTALETYRTYVEELVGARAKNSGR